MITVVDAQLANLIQVSWLLLIPIGVLVALLLYKLVFSVAQHPRADDPSSLRGGSHDARPQRDNCQRQ